MKKLLIVFIISFIFAFAGDLSAYIAKYDKELAIELYNEELSEDTENVQIYKAMVELYRETGKIGLAEDCYRHLLRIDNGAEGTYKNYLQFLYDNASYEKLRMIIQVKGFEEDWSNILIAESYFKEAKFDSSMLFTRMLPQDRVQLLQALSLEGMDIKYRSPALGGIMSVIIPGSGKIYAGRLFDGLQAFTVVAAPAYNAYYHFSKNGPASVQAWIWTAVASWFYLSDIYGSVKAVHEYNEMQELKIIERYEP